MLASDYVLQAAVRILDKVARGRMRLEVACEGPLTIDDQKRRVLAVIGPNVQTLRHLLRRNHADFFTAIARQSFLDERQQARRRLVVRQAKAIRLVEETIVRSQHLATVVARLKDIARQMDGLRQELAELRSGGDPALAAETRKELRRLMRITHDTPARLHRHLCRSRRGGCARQRPPGTLFGQPAAGRLDCQALSQPRAQLPRSDSRGEHGVAPGGRQVRARPRFQVLHLRHVVGTPGNQPGDCRSQPHDPRAGSHAEHGGQGDDGQPGGRPALQSPAHAGGDRAGGGPLGGRHPSRDQSQPPHAVA